VVFTLRHPHELTATEREVFSAGGSEKKGNKGSRQSNGIQEGDDSIPGCPFEAVHAVALPKRMLNELPGYDHDPCVCVISVAVLKAMRPTSFVAASEAKPWLAGLVLLPSSCLVRSYSLVVGSAAAGDTHSEDDDDEYDDIRSRGKYPPSWVRDSDDSVSLSQEITLVRPESATEYLTNMARIRTRADELGLLPLYHFTNPNVVSMILKGGIRMSTQGQGVISSSRASFVSIKFPHILNFHFFMFFLFIWNRMAVAISARLALQASISERYRWGQIIQLDSLHFNWSL
jgi:hypothetical protein